MTAARHVIDSRGVASHLAVLYEVLVGGDPQPSDADYRSLLVQHLPAPSERQVWLILAVLSARLPTSDEVQTWSRRVTLDGIDALLSIGRGKPVRILAGGVIVDAHHTLGTTLSTGIQRVARSVLNRWSESREYALVAWDATYRSIHEMPADAHRNLVKLSRNAVPVIPWDCVYVLPELAVESPRLSRFEAIVRYAATSSGVIGFDTVPMTSAETCGPGMPAGFSRNLAAVAHVSKVATISDAAKTEYDGWRSMVRAAGLVGPEIAAIEVSDEPIPSSGEPVDPREVLGLGPDPIVMCLGSHEPRKNHMAVLHAAEVMWREGRSFQLVFCGGNGWNSSHYVDRVAELTAAGRPIHSYTGLDDATVSGLMRDARFSVFPSLSEGYGLPVAESLAVGTPCITTNYGSTAAIAAGGGAMLIDPRNDADIVSAMRALLSDDALVARLSSQARGMRSRSWAAYADELWSFFVG